MKYNNYIQTQHKNYTHWYYQGEGQEEAGPMSVKNQLCLEMLLS